MLLPVHGPVEFNVTSLCDFSSTSVCFPFRAPLIRTALCYVIFTWLRQSTSVCFPMRAPLNQTALCPVFFNLLGRIMTVATRSQASWIVCLIIRVWAGDSANAVPLTKKLRTRVIYIWDYRLGQPSRSAMGRPHQRRTSLMIKVSPVPGKYASFRSDDEAKETTVSVNRRCGRQ